jgi:hypothetical protein
LCPENVVPGNGARGGRPARARSPGAGLRRPAQSPGSGFRRSDDGGRPDCRGSWDSRDSWGGKAPDASALPPGALAAFAGAPTTWMTLSCCSSDMNAAFTSYPRAARTYQQSQQSLRAQDYRRRGRADGGAADDQPGPGGNTV